MSKLIEPKPIKISRRAILRLGVASSISLFSVNLIAAANKLVTGVTPAQTEGPFYPNTPQDDKDLDLTIISGHNQRAQGQVIEVQGQVVDNNGIPIANALVDIWQANTWGRYSHTKDNNPAPLDPHFQGWGQVLTDANGSYRFITIMPGAYPAAPDWVRPPHIHFKVTVPGFINLTTQMYFAGQVLNNSDLILNRLAVHEQQRVIAKPQSNSGRVVRYEFNIMLRASPL